MLKSPSHLMSTNGLLSASIFAYNGGGVELGIGHCSRGIILG